MTTQSGKPFYSYSAPLNHSAKLCLGCKKSRSRAQFVGESEVCMQCARRGIAPTPVKRRGGK